MQDRTDPVDRSGPAECLLLAGKKSGGPAGLTEAKQALERGDYMLAVKLLESITARPR